MFQAGMDHVGPSLSHGLVSLLWLLRARYCRTTRKHEFAPTFCARRLKQSIAGAQASG